MLNNATASSSMTWLSCFDTSAAATAAYCAVIYGLTASAARIAGAAFNWSNVAVIFPQFLRRAAAAKLTQSESVTKCLLRSESVYKTEMMHAIWVNYRSHASTGHVPYDHFINRGGSRKPCEPANWGWIEVMHQPSLSISRWYQSSWSDQLWMYVANGSGLWYNAGRTLLCSDSIDLASYLNYTQYRRRTGDTKPPLFEEARRRLVRSFDSISFDSHIDGSCCHRMVMHEVFSLKRTNLKCPVSDRMRRGVPPNLLRACDCTQGLASTVPPGPRRCPPDTGQWPQHPAAPGNKSRIACEYWARNQLLQQHRSTGFTPSVLSGDGVASLERACAATAAARACGGACCRHTPWPFGMSVPANKGVEPVC